MTKVIIEKRKRFNVSLLPSVHKKAMKEGRLRHGDFSSFIENLIVQHFCNTNKV